MSGTAMPRRTYEGEQYLRAEHLYRDGKYRSVNIEIRDVVHDCPIKKGDKDSTTIALAFVGSNKILGLNRTNESVLCEELGDSRWEKWIGKKITLVVRLVRNKKVEEPAIRIWPRRPHSRGQVRDQMGKPITDEWYADEAKTVTEAKE